MTNILSKISGFASEIFGKKKADGITRSFAAADSKSFISFKDIAGSLEAKESVSDITDYIKNPEKYIKYGARIPKGVMLYGPPGTGKTMLARAIAGEAGVPFFSVSGSDFVQMYVGVGASRIRKLFKTAGEAKKAVIFIDEIDALAKKRSMGGSGNDERDQTLNALLSEMSGFDSSQGIVVIAATNRLDVLDDALLRPGRFDRQIEMRLPDCLEREKILRLHAEGKPMSALDFKALARLTVNFSGSMLENLLNEAAISAAKNDVGEITQELIENAYYRLIAGNEKSESAVKQEEKKLASVHEAGHALVSRLLLPENTVARVSIIPSTKGAGGYCINIPADRMYITKKEVESQMLVLLSGRAAEEVVFGEERVTTGASNDIERVSAIMRDYAGRFGMNGNLLSCAVFGDGGLASVCGGLIDALYAQAKALICENRDKLERISELLMEKEAINAEELDLVLSLAV